MMLERRLFRVLEFPKHLQTTVIALLKLGRATAEDVAKVTGKARAVESAYLNQLVVMKVVQKERQGRKAFFMVDLEGLNW
jgi:predicted transcriptional regulator